MKLLQPYPEHTTIIIKGRIKTQSTTKSFSVTGNDITYKMKRILTAIHNDNTINDPFKQYKHHTFSVYFNDQKLTIQTHLELDIYVNMIKEYINQEKWK